MAKRKTPTESSAADPLEQRRKRVEAVCARLRRGTPINHACALEGVTRSVFYEWLEADEEIAAMVAKARAVAGEAMRAKLMQLITRDRKAANVMLHVISRQFPDEWAEAPKKLEHTGRNGGPIATSGGAETLSTEQLMALLPDALEALKPKNGGE